MSSKNYVGSNSFESVVAKDPQVAHLRSSPCASLASDAAINRAVEGLHKKGFETVVVNSRDDALAQLVNYIPEGASIFATSSHSLVEIGWKDFVDANPTKYHDINAKVHAAPKEQTNKIRFGEGALADFFLTSVNAITESGEILSADSTGTRLMGFFSAGKVIVVVGTNKIVPDTESAYKRLHEYSHPLTSAWIRAVYPGYPGMTLVNTVRVQDKQAMDAPGKIRVIFVKERLGF